MANHHLRNRELSLKAKGLLSLMLSLPEDWDYTTKGLSCICKDGVDSICATIKELEKAGYVKRRRLRDAQGRLSDLEYTILEKPEPLPSPPESPQRENPVVVKPDVVEPDVDNPELGKPHTENPAQLSIQEVNKQPPRRSSRMVSSQHSGTDRPSLRSCFSITEAQKHSATSC